MVLYLLKTAPTRVGAVFALFLSFLMSVVFPAMFAPFAHFNIPLNELLVFAGMVIDHLADFATELY